MSFSKENTAKFFKLLKDVEDLKSIVASLKQTIADLQQKLDKSCCAKIEKVVVKEPVKEPEVITVEEPVKDIQKVKKIKK